MTKRSVRSVARAALGLALAGLLGPGTARAEETPAAEGTPPAGGDAAAAPATTRPLAAASGSASPTALTLHQGGISFDGDVVINMSKDQVAKPIQIVPNLYYGVSNELTAGVAHNPGAEVFQAGGGAANAPRGFCISGANDGCPRFYDNISADALFSFSRSSAMDLAAHVGVDFLKLSPDLLLSARVGVKGKLAAGPIIVVFDPALNIGAINRNAGNKEFLSVPLRVGVMAGSRLNIGASIGLFGPVDPDVGGFGDAYTIPVGFGGAFGVNQMLDVRAQFTFTNLAGKNSSADERALSIGAAFHM